MKISYIIHKLCIFLRLCMLIRHNFISLSPQYIYSHQNSFRRHARYSHIRYAHHKRGSAVFSVFVNVYQILYLGLRIYELRIWLRLWNRYITDLLSSYNFVLKGLRLYLKRSFSSYSFKREATLREHVKVVEIRQFCHPCTGFGRAVPKAVTSLIII